MSTESLSFPVARIEDIACSHKGAIKIGPFGSQLKKEDMRSRGIKVYGQENVITGSWVAGGRRVSTSKAISLSTCQLVSGDVVVTMMGTIGRCSIFPDDAEPGIMDSHLLRIQPDPAIIDRGYLSYVLADPVTLGRQVSRMSHGSIMAGLSSSIVRKLVIPRPPLPEQRRIAEIFAALDEAIRKTEQVIAKLQQIKQGLLHDLLTRGIDENGELRDPERPPEQFKDSPLGRIPRGWEVKTLGELAGRITDGTHQAVKTIEPGPETIPFLFVSCVRDGAIDWSKAAAISPQAYKDISRGREAKVGMVLYTAVGSYGHAAHVETFSRFAFQRHVACIYPDEDIIRPSVLSAWLNSPPARLYADRVALGNAQKTVTIGALTEFPVPVPSLAEQKLIEERISAITEKITAEWNELNKCRSFKQGLMDDLLTGRVRVPIVSEAAAD